MRLKKASRLSWKSDLRILRSNFKKGFRVQGFRSPATGFWALVSGQKQEGRSQQPGICFLAANL
jgi:hypothetical protein